MVARILLIGTLDTKEDEFRFVRDVIREKGHQAMLMDVGILRDPRVAPDIEAKRVAQAGGQSLEELRSLKDRTHALDIMTAGARKLTASLYENNDIDGVLSLGGGSGTALATAAMRELPVGVPKMMVSSVASGDISPYVDIKDVTFMYSVADISGLNRLSRRILRNAAGAVCGMIDPQETGNKSGKPLLAATMFGVTTPCVEAVRKKIEASGHEMVVFHATGSGGRAMETMIKDGYISAVADLTTTEWCDEVVGGVLSAGPARLEAAGHAGIPQVVSCGALDMVNFHDYRSVPDRFKDRTLHRHTSEVTLLRTTPAECKEIGKRIAGKLNQAKGPVVLMIPLRGVSMIDQEGEPFYDPEANRALFDALKTHIDSKVTVRELDLHINDPAFADAVADELLGMLKEIGN